MRLSRFLQILVTAGTLSLLLVSAGRTWREMTPFVGIVASDGANGLRIEQVLPGSPAERAGLQAGDRLLEVGGVPVASGLAAGDQFAGAEPGRNLGVVVLRFGQALSASLPVGAVVTWYWGRVAASIIALLFLVGGLAALLRPRKGSASLVYALWCLTGALMLGVSWSARADLLDWVLFWTDRTARLLFPALWIHLVLCLKGARPHQRRWLPAIYAPAVALMVVEIHIVGFSGALRADDPVGFVDLLQSRLEMGWIGVGLLAGLSLLALRAIRGPDAAARVQARWILTGSLAGVMPFLALTWLPEVAIGSEPNWSWAGLPFLALVPLTFTPAVLEYRLMDLALFGRRLISALLMLGLTGILFLGLLSLTRLIVPLLIVPAGIVPVLVAAVITAALAPAVRAGVRDLVGRIYYRRRYSFRRALERVARELNSEQDLPRLAEVLERRIGEALDADPVRLLLVGRDGRLVNAVDRRPVAANLESDLRERLEAGRTVSLADVSNAPEELPSLHLAGVQVLVPLRVEGRMIALLAIGARRHGGLLDSDDLDLLRSVSAHAAAAVSGALHLNQLREQVALVRRLQTRTEALLEGSPIGLVMIDPEGVIRHWNPAMEALLEIAHQDALDRSYIDVLPQELRGFVRDALYAVRRPQRRFRVRLSCPRGERLVNLTCSPLGGPPTVDGLLLTLDDVTEQVRMEEQLIQQDRLASVGMLAAGVAHEVNTPLTGISSYAQILLEETPDDDPRKPLLEKVVRQAARASQIARGLLSISRPGAAEGLAVGPVDLIETAEETIGLLGPQIRQAKASVTCEHPEKSVVVLGDRSRLQQVVMNLLLNAIDAVGPGGQVWVKAWIERDGMARLEIRDDGVGIAVENRDRIFDPFFTTKGGGKGTGLGLSISYAIVREHSGTLVVESEPGQGTAVRMLLPEAADSALGRRAVGSAGAG